MTASSPHFSDTLICKSFLFVAVDVPIHFIYIFIQEAFNLKKKCLIQTMKAIIIGSGGHAAELVDYIRFSNCLAKNEAKITISGFLNDNFNNYLKYNFHFPFLGQIIPHQIRQDVHYIIEISNLVYRKKIVEHFIGRGASFYSTHILQFLFPHQQSYGKAF